MSKHMFKYGVAHGLLIIIIMIGLGFIGTTFQLNDGAIEIIYAVILFVPLMIIGYLYKKRTGISPIDALATSKGKILLYPFGVAIFTTALSGYGMLNSPTEKSSDIGSLMWVVLIAVGLFSHTLKIATAIWFGSWFRRSHS